MFGHENQDDQAHGNDPQITLPQTQSFSDDATATDSIPTPPPALQEAEPSVEQPVDHRKTAKTGAPTDNLLDIKQEVLQALTPLVDHLEQSPEEKFRTTMMMIQASDNHALIRTAYDAAQKITNEKERAQALLDIVNEINYFTQQNQAA